MNMYGEPLRETDYERLRQSWLTNEIVDRAGIRRVDDIAARQIVGRSSSAKGNYAGILIPYYFPGEAGIREVRLRRDEPDIEVKNGQMKERARYLSPPGRSNLVYFPPGVEPSQLADPNLPLAITEGEKKALALDRLATWDLPQMRFLAIALGGVWNWRGTIGKEPGPNGERRDVKGPIPDLERVSWAERKAFIAFDANVATNPSVRAAREQLANELKARGAKVSFVTVPQQDGVNGIDDFLAKNGPEAGLRLFEDAIEAGPIEINASDHDMPRITARAWDALRANNFPPRIFRYAGTIARLVEGDPPSIELLNEHALRHESARSARWFKTGKNGPVPAYPPVAIMRDMSLRRNRLCRNSTP